MSEMKNQPEALRLADKYEAHGFLGDHRFAKDQWCSQAAAELRRQHARIAELEDQMAAIGAGGVESLRCSRQAHKCREALAACINLLRKTPKITRDIYVGKDRQAWGVQAKAVLDAALAALNQKDEK